MTNRDDKALRCLHARLPGRVSAPGDVPYARATSIWARPLDINPKAVVHCRSSVDVRSAVRVAREFELPLSVRGCGHDWAGRSLCDGVVIDMTAMNAVTMQARGSSVSFGGGASASDVLQLLDPLGLAVVTGSSGAVGMTGLSLGGGYGPLIGAFGLALDNILAAEVVLADGRVVMADARDNADLFWALRGGGGNFGVVTEMRMSVHHLPSVCSGVLLFPFAEARAVIEGCIEIADFAPDALTCQIVLVAGPDAAPIVMVVPTWCGFPKEGEDRVRPFEKLGAPLINTLACTTYGKSLTAFDAHVVDGNRVIIETCWLPRLDRVAVDTLIDAMRNAASPGCAIVTHDFKGHASRIAEATTAFGLRRDHVLVEIIASYTPAERAAEEERHAQWTRRTLQALSPQALPGGYPNLLASGDPERVMRSYGGNAVRLAAAKRQYDPDNVFHSAIPLPRS